MHFQLTKIMFLMLQTVGHVTVQCFTHDVRNDGLQKLTDVIIILVIAVAQWSVDIGDLSYTNVHKTTTVYGTIERRPRYVTRGR